MRRVLALSLYLGFVMLVWTAVPAAQGAPPAAAPVSAEAVLTQSSIRVGDQVGLRVSVTHHHQIQVEFPTLYGRLGDLEVLGRKPLPATRQLDGTQVSTMEYTITGFVPGRYNLPRMTISYVDPQGEKGTVETDQNLTLEIVSVLVNLPDEGLRDIKPPLAIPRDPAIFAYTAGLVVLAVGTLGLSLALYRRWTRGLRRPLLPAFQPGPEEAARAELERITKLDLLKKEDYIAYYSLISTCIRRYLDARLDLDALASTTQELRLMMDDRGIDRWQARVISGLLEECDAAKWAHYQPASARAQRTLTIAFEIVDLVSNSNAHAPASGALAET